MIEVISIPTYTDNYVWLIKNTENNHCCVIDPGQAEPVITVLKHQGLILDAILITHHHYDHIDGIPELLTATAKTAVTIYSSIAIPSLNVSVPFDLNVIKDGDTINLLNNELKLNVLSTPGHKREHIVFHNDKLLFSGDTLFSGGCGRILDGTPCELFHSLQKITQLNDDLLVYPTHEYTQSNLMFCHAVEPHNKDIKLALAQTAKLRQQGLPTLPSTLKKEKKINVFLRSHEPMIRAHLEQKLVKILNSEEAVFTELRAWKDNF